MEILSHNFMINSNVHEIRWHAARINTPS